MITIKTATAEWAAFPAANAMTQPSPAHRGLYWENFVGVGTADEEFIGSCTTADLFSMIREDLAPIG
jgi:hypothetical protein